MPYFLIILILFVLTTKANAASPFDSFFSAGLSLGIDQTTLAQEADFASPQSVSDQSNVSQTRSFWNQFTAQYFAILFGPPLSKLGSGYQAAPSGTLDPDRPVILKNFLELGYPLSDTVKVAGSAYWIWQPTLQSGFQVEDPFLKVSYASSIGLEQLSFYGDFRTHFPISSVSKANQLNLGLQSVQGITYSFDIIPISIGFFTSQRYNFLTSGGFGNNVEFYFAPNVNWQMLPDLSLTLLYEIQVNHVSGDPSFLFRGDGTDIEPGISWDITPNLTFNPYLHIWTGQGTSLSSTSFGMLLSWIFL